MLDKLKDMLGMHTARTEADVADDDHLAQSRDTGGLEGGTGDAASTTGTAASEGFVGRVAGQDDGAERTSGAEARAFGAHDDAVTGDEPATGREAPGRD